MADKEKKKPNVVPAAEEGKEGKVIEIPKADADLPLSKLSGVTVMAIDVDPEESLRLVKENLLLNGQTLLSVIQHEFHGRPPYGFIVVFYDPKADKGHADFGKAEPPAAPLLSGSVVPAGHGLIGEGQQ